MNIVTVVLIASTNNGKNEIACEDKECLDYTAGPRPRTVFQNYYMKLHWFCRVEIKTGDLQASEHDVFCCRCARGGAGQLEIWSHIPAGLHVWLTGWLATRQPARQPAIQPASYSTSQPVSQPASQPASQSTASHQASQPTNQTTKQPNNQPINQQTDQPTNQQINQQTNQTNKKQTSQPTNQPSNHSSIQNLSNQQRIFLFVS